MKQTRNAPTRLWPAVLILAWLSAGFQAPFKPVKPPQIPVLLTIIKNITPFYDDCRMVLSLNGSAFGTAAHNREVFMETPGFHYTPQIVSWSNTKIDVELKGDFPLGRAFKVFIRDLGTQELRSNKADWRSLTQIKAMGGFKPGQQIACSGCLLGSSQGGRVLSIGGSAVQATQWTCEDIIFNVPAKQPGVYPMQLMENGVGISNIVQFKID